MYKYETTKVRGLQFCRTTADIGDVFKKTYPVEGANSFNQKAIVAIIEGSFTFSVPSVGFYKTLVKGQTSLELDVEYPKDVICEETPAEENSVRYCIKAYDNSLIYTREIIVLNHNEEVNVSKGDIIFIVEGSLTYNNTFYNIESILNVTEDKTFISTSKSKLIKFIIGSK